VIDRSLNAGRWLALPLLCLGLAGCGSSGSSGGNTALNVLMFQSATPPPADQLPKDDDGDVIVCPEVIVADGGAAVRQGGQDAGAVRYQISINDVARECTATGKGGGYRLKVGVQGRVLLGQSGGAGAYGATLSITVTQGGAVVARRSARVGASIPGGQTGADFTHIEDGIVVPPGRGDVEVMVGLGQGGAAPARQRRR
jgi:hypothetical protein